MQIPSIIITRFFHRSDRRDDSIIFYSCFCFFQNPHYRQPDGKYPDRVRKSRAVTPLNTNT